MKLTDMCSLEHWKALEKKIASASGLDVNIFNVKGYRITDYKHWANRLCPAIKATDRGQSFICAVAHMNIAAQAERAGKEIIEECDAGLVKMVIPIFHKNEFIGSVGACGLLLNDGEVDAFLVNKITGIEEEKIETLSKDIENITSNKLKSLAEITKKEIERHCGEVKAYDIADHH